MSSGRSTTRSAPTAGALAAISRRREAVTTRQAQAPKPLGTVESFRPIAGIGPRTRFAVRVLRVVQDGRPRAGYKAGTGPVTNEFGAVTTNVKFRVVNVRVRLRPWAPSRSRDVRPEADVVVYRESARAEQWLFTAYERLWRAQEHREGLIEAVSVDLLGDADQLGAVELDAHPGEQFVEALVARPGAEGAVEYRRTPGAPPRAAPRRTGRTRRGRAGPTAGRASSPPAPAAPASACSSGTTTHLDRDVQRPPQVARDELGDARERAGRRRSGSAAPHGQPPFSNSRLASAGSCG